VFNVEVEGWLVKANPHTLWMLIETLGGMVEVELGRDGSGLKELASVIDGRRYIEGDTELMEIVRGWWDG